MSTDYERLESELACLAKARYAADCYCLTKYSWHEYLERFDLFLSYYGRFHNLEVYT